MTGRTRGRLAVVAGLFASLAIGIALFRMRLSPLYPQLNDINSDFYVYQVVGNSWTHGDLPYRDVYDVKGPFFYLLFGLFATVRPWSVGPALVTLTVLAFAGLWLAFLIARRFVGFVAAVWSALASGTLIYLTVVDVPTSFSCEEVAVPGVLLMLWLMLRAIDGDPVPAWWWVVDGLAFGALFWSKYQVIAPWGAVLIALLVIGARRGMPLRELSRIVLLHVAGLAVVTLVVLTAYSSALAVMLRAYFLAKINLSQRGDELAMEGSFIRTMWHTNTTGVITLLVVLAIFAAVAAAPGRGSTETRTVALVFAIASVLSMWAAVVGVRHPTNIVVPSCFVAVALPMALALVPCTSAARIAAAAVVTALAAVSVIPSVRQSQADYGLFRSVVPVRCRMLPSAQPVTGRSVSAIFAAEAHGNPILSVNNLLAARTLYRTHTAPQHRFSFVDVSWAVSAGAANVQLRYLQDRVFSYVWVGIALWRDGPESSGHAAGSLPQQQFEVKQRRALHRHYVPTLGCGGQLLLRAK